METDISHRTASIAVINSVADREGISPVNLTDPLCETIDTDSLDSIADDDDVCVTFEYHGYTVTINGENRVEVTSPDRA